jgi:hypothetical protein
MIQDGKLVCDGCRTVITRITQVPAEGWSNIRNLCPTCFRDLRARSVTRA